MNNQIKIETIKRDYYVPESIFNVKSFKGFTLFKSWGEEQTSYGWTPYGVEKTLCFNKDKFFVEICEMDLDDPFQTKTSTYDVLNNEELLALLNKEN